MLITADFYGDRVMHFFQARFYLPILLLRAHAMNSVEQRNLVILDDNIPGDFIVNDTNSKIFYFLLN